MNRNISILTVIFSVLFLSGCARVSLDLNQNGEIRADGAGGYTSPERYLDIQDKQGKTETLVFLNKQLRLARLSNNVKREIHLINLINSIRQETPYPLFDNKGNVLLQIKNVSSNYNIKVGDETLSPGQISQSTFPFLYGKKSKMEIGWIDRKTKQRGTTKAKINTTRATIMEISVN